MAKVSLQRIINTNYVKYERLIPMINSAFVNSTADHINIYIDLYSMVKSLCNENIMIEDYSDLSSCIINMCAHYRAFFATRYKTTSSFYIINTLNKPSLNSKLFKGYNERVNGLFASKKMIIDMVSNNIGLLKILCPYLPDIYFIDRTTQESAVVIFDLMCRDINNEQGHMIITKDKYLNRLCSMKPQTVVVRPKKKDNQDISEIITIFNLLDNYFEDRKVNTRSQILSPDLLTHIMMLSGCKERNIDSMFNVSRSVKSLEKLVRSGELVNRYTPDIASVMSVLSKEFDTPELILANRYKVLDIQYQHLVYIANPVNNDYSLEIVNLVDNDTVREINNKYFLRNPLDLNRL